jgi:hypothetical membrane protein
MQEEDTSLIEDAGGVAGVIAPILFTELVIIESALRPGFNQISEEISLLGVGSYEIIQNLNFVITGSLRILFALGLARAMAGRRRRRNLLIVLSIFGVGVILAGVTLILASPYPEDSSTAISFFYVHTFVSLVAFVAIIVAQFLTWKGLDVATDRSHWRSFRTYSLVSGIISVIFLFIFFLTSFSKFEGATERLVVAIDLVWIEIGGFKLLSSPKKSELQIQR